MTVQRTAASRPQQVRTLCASRMLARDASGSDTGINRDGDRAGDDGINADSVPAPLNLQVLSEPPTISQQRDSHS
jgi:hypothetical protein